MSYRQGFTVIELMVVVAILVVLTSIAIPNYITMQKRAKEASLLNSAHALSLAAENYSVMHDVIYSDRADDLLPLLPGAQRLENVFTGLRTEPQFGWAAISPGQIGITLVVQSGVSTGYRITAFGAEGLVLVRDSRG